MYGVVEKSGVKVNLTAVIRGHDSQIVFGLEQPSDKLMTLILYDAEIRTRVRIR